MLIITNNFALKRKLRRTKIAELQLERWLNRKCLLHKREDQSLIQTTT